MRMVWFGMTVSELLFRRVAINVSVVKKIIRQHAFESASRSMVSEQRMIR